MTGVYIRGKWSYTAIDVQHCGIEAMGGSFVLLCMFFARGDLCKKDVVWGL